MTIKLLAAAAGLGLVAHSATLTAALLPVLGVAVAVEAVWVLHRTRRRQDTSRRPRHAYGA
jgi:hypothetical protein